ncbi:MAG: hypothetical protein UT33_C0015G0032 [Candidatus Peregrinibacteria bacterium GW2011_GWC2_39_14]|nr:MAG: hypothetical protein US92_C0009G0016 [Candidatus Peregrinibacteria bacterium GW2011_GWA2_38_36]KKR04975.1 MAG: hypothetical protein UT33_C0015G0032 [Candidatus Peregrinibacteria bacterium GW2011_GWC2_39_14]
MLKLFNKNRLKAGLVIASLLFCIFIIPAAADVLAYSSANLVKGEVSRMIAQTGTPPAVAPAVKPPAEGTSVIPKTVEVEESVKLLLDIMKILSIVLQLLARLLWPILFFCGALMENDIIFGGAMGERLHDVWIQIRNIANLLFVLMLVGTAIYNISGFASEKLQLKQMLPKIIMGLILVNFSYMISTVALDAISVGTTAMFGLPRAIGIAMTDSVGSPINITDAAQNNLCLAFTSAGKLGSETLKEAGAAIKKVGDEMSKKMQNAYCEPDKAHPGKFVASQKLQAFIGEWAPHSATIIMAVQFMHMQDLQNVAMGNELTLSSLMINMLFSMVMFFIYGMAFVILFIVLLMRAITVWLVIVLSPLLVVVYVVPEITEKAGGSMKEVVTKAVSISTAPMVIGFVLSIGYIMMTSLASTGQAGGGAQFSTLLESTLTMNANVSGLADFQEIMIAIGTVGFIWAGIKAATDKTIAKGATDTITKGVSSAGAWLGKAAVMYPSIIPVPGGSHEGKESMGTLLKTFDKAVRAPELASDERASALAQRMGIEKGSAGSATLENELSKVRGTSDLSTLDGVMVKVQNLDQLTPGVVKGIEQGIKNARPLNGHSGDDAARVAYEKAQTAVATLRRESSTEAEKKTAKQSLLDAAKEFRISSAGEAAQIKAGEAVDPKPVTPAPTAAPTAPVAAVAADTNGAWKTEIGRLKGKVDPELEKGLEGVVAKMKAANVDPKDQKEYIKKSIEGATDAQKAIVDKVVDSVNQATPAATATTPAPVAPAATAGTTPAPASTATPPPTSPMTGTLPVIPPPAAPKT